MAYGIMWQSTTTCTNVHCESSNELTALLGPGTSSASSMLSIVEVPFLEDNENLGAATRQKILAILTNPQITCKSLLQLELTVINDCGKPFVKATYALDQGWALVLECVEVISTIQAAICTVHMANIRFVHVCSYLQKHIKITN